MGNVASTLRRLFAYLLASPEGTKKQELSVLVIGPPNSGKTTIIRRLLLDTGKEAAPTELSKYKLNIFQNILEVAEKIHEYLNARKLISTADYSYAAELRKTLRSQRAVFEESNKRKTVILSKDLVEALYAAANHTSVYDIVQCGRHEEIGLAESDVYFLDGLLRIGRADYVPTLQDVLNVWTPRRRGTFPTTDIPSTYVEVGNVRIHFEEVNIVGGGDTSDRPDIGRCGQPALTVYCVPLDAYRDKAAFEEIIAGWKKILEQTISFGGRTAIVLNRIDVFIQALEKIPLSQVYPGSVLEKYERGPLQAAEYIGRLFYDESLEEGADSYHFLVANSLNHSIQPLREVLIEIIAEL